MPLARSVKRTVATKFSRQPLLLFDAQPRRIRRRILQHKQHGEPQQHSRNSLKQKQPLPSAQAAQSIEPQQRTRQRRTNNACQRSSRHKRSHSTRPFMRRKPVGQIKQHSRNKTRLRHAQQKPQQVEGMRRPASAPCNAETRPHEIMIRAIQTRVPKRRSSRLLGRSNSE